MRDEKGVARTLAGYVLAGLAALVGGLYVMNRDGFEASEKLEPRQGVEKVVESEPLRILPDFRVFIPGNARDDKDEEPVYETKTEYEVEDGGKISYKTNDFSQDSDAVLLARMLFGEARNCRDKEKIAIAYTAINRVNDGKRWNGETLREVILKPWQYSCFNENDSNRKKLMDPEKCDAESWQNCLMVAEDILKGEYSDPVNGATHYFNPDVVKPGWADKMTKIGRVGDSRHEFYRED